MTNHAADPGNGMCKLCLRDLFQFGLGDKPYCNACRLLLQRHPGVDPATVSNGRTERLPQERPSSDPHWADDGAACAGAPGELFEHRLLRNPSIAAEVRQVAELFCGNCPIMQRCRAEADAHEFLGVWGGQWRYYDNHGHRYAARDLIREKETAA